MKQQAKLTEAEWRVEIEICTHTEAVHHVIRYIWIADAENIPIAPPRSNKSCRTKRAAKQTWERFARKNNYVSWRFVK